MLYAPTLAVQEACKYMSEIPVRNDRLLQAHNTGERNEVPSVEAARESLQQHYEHQPDAKAQAVERSQSLESARKAVQEKAISTAETASLGSVEQTSSDQSHSFAMHQQLKTNAYAQTLRTIQRRLPRTDQAFSKVIHNRRVEAVSEVAAKSVARPSGILGGAIFALIGSALLVYITRHYGFPYNYTMFIIFFVGGYGIGLILELAVQLLRHRRHN